MDIPVRDILQGILTATCPQVTISIPVALKVTIYGAHQSKTSNIKFTLLIKKGLFDVFLNNVTSLNTIDCGVLNKSLNMVQIFADLNSTPPVSVLSRLNDPQLLSKLR